MSFNKRISVVTHEVEPTGPKLAVGRFSTYTLVSSSASTNASIETNSINDIDESLQRLSDRRLINQRFVPTEKKKEDLSKLALGAKVERALRWRMDSQDFIPRLEKCG
jgi:hypothetical protein